MPNIQAASSTTVEEIGDFLNFDRIKADNRIFRALSPQEWTAWQPHLEPLAWQEGAVVADVSQPASQVCFPTQGVLSLQALATPNVNLALIGREGVIGLVPPAELVKPCKVVAETAGAGWRIERNLVHAAMAASGHVMLLLLRYQQALTVQMTQAALCRQHHTLEQQVCRWLLLGQDWLEGPDRVAPVDVSSEFVGQRTEDLVQVVHSLQASSLIECEWPRVTVRDQAGLARRCCECYEAIKREYQLL